MPQANVRRVRSSTTPSGLRELGRRGLPHPNRGEESPGGRFRRCCRTTPERTGWATSWEERSRVVGQGGKEIPAF